MESTEGLVIKCKDYRETSQLVWLYTRDFGKIKVIAKGSRKKSKIDLFNLCDIVFYKGRGELHLLKECSILDPFIKIRQDLKRIATASYFAELLDATTALEDPSPQIYSLAIDVFKRLAEGKDPLSLRHFFEVKLMQYLGNLPSEGLKGLKRLSIDYSIDKRLKSLDFLEKGGCGI